MVELIVAAMVLLIGATIAVFLILIAVDFALFLKLRSSIPQQRFSDVEQ